MAICSDNFLKMSSLIIIFAVIALCVPNAAVADMPMMMPMRDFTGDVDSCEAVCLSAFTNSKTTDQNVCRRGCRLMSMISFMGSDGSSLEELRDSCYKSCKEAYADVDSEGACAFGCQSQLPVSEAHRKQISDYGDSQHQQMGGMMSAWSSLRGYGRRMIGCMRDYVEHQVRVGWYIYSSPDGITADDSKMTVIVTSSGSSSSSEEDIDNIGQDKVDVAGVSGGVAKAGDAAVEHKTSNYIETNLAMAATPNAAPAAIGNLPQFDVAIVEADHLDVAEPSRHEDGIGSDDNTNDWLYCLERRTGTSKKLVLSVFVVSLVLILYVCVNATSNAHSSAHVQKLTINGGDLRYLTQLEDKEFLIKMVPQDSMSSSGSEVGAAPLPMKMPVQVA